MDVEAENPWPRNPTEKLISAYFNRPLEQFAAVLDALRSVLADVPVIASAETIKTSLDPIVCDVIEELLFAGFSILCPNQRHALTRSREICEDSQNTEEDTETRQSLLDFITVDACAYATPVFLMNAFDEVNCVKSDVQHPAPRTNLRGLLEFMKICLAYDQQDLFRCLYDNATCSLKVRLRQFLKQN
ncbi:unnamed protein product [Schistocephalus solidus]|uniref:CASPASE_P10 domain-containing protein n=1 Tax=Schistocephalus solidus TaxID=70667 RepID=A0A183TBC7_SCHSO|nr:unnamed protein product [Schistocephalus solidus]